MSRLTIERRSTTDATGQPFVSPAVKLNQASAAPWSSPRASETPPFLRLCSLMLVQPLAMVFFRICLKRSKSLDPVWAAYTRPVGPRHGSIERQQTLCPPLHFCSSRGVRRPYRVSPSCLRSGRFTRQRNTVSRALFFCADHPKLRTCLESRCTPKGPRGHVEDRLSPSDVRALRHDSRQRSISKKSRLRVEKS